MTGCAMCMVSDHPTGNYSRSKTFAIKQSAKVWNIFQENCSWLQFKTIPHNVHHNQHLNNEMKKVNRLWILKPMISNWLGLKRKYRKLQSKETLKV